MINDRDDRDKPSWRDRDAKNNKSPHAIKDEKPAFKSSKDKRQESLAKKDLDDLFKPKISKEENKAWNAVMKFKGAEFSKSASAYVEKFGYPKDWNDMMYLLDHEDCDFVSKTLAHMNEHFAEQTPTKKELFAGKLKVLLASCDDYGLSKTIQSILASQFPA